MDEPNEHFEASEAEGALFLSAPPIHSRFLFVDVAALRAKQLRRGAVIRFDREVVAPEPLKPERIAMEEVRRGLVEYRVLDEQAARLQGDPVTGDGAMGLSLEDQP